MSYYTYYTYCCNGGHGLRQGVAKTLHVYDIAHPEQLKNSCWYLSCNRGADLYFRDVYVHDKFHVA